MSSTVDIQRSDHKSHVLAEKKRVTRLNASLLRRLTALGPTAFIFGIGGLGMSSTQAVALRLMSSSEVGRFVLVYGIASVGSTCVGLGLPQLMARTASVDQSQVSWRRPAWVVSTVLALIPSMLIAAGVMVAFPALQGWGPAAFGLLVFLMLTANLQALESSLLRACGKFVSGAVVLQGALILVTGALLVPLVLERSVSALDALWIMLGAQVLLIVASGWKEVLRSRSVVGEVTTWIRGRPKLLLGFWLSGVVAMSFRWADRLTVGGILALHDLTVYQSLFLLTSLYDLLGVAIGYLNLPKYARAGSWSRQSNWFILVLGTMTTIVTASIGLALGTKIFLIQWQSTTIVTFVLLMGAGMFKLAYAEISAVVGALGHGGQVLTYSILSGGTLVVGVVATAAFGLTWGLIGAAAGSLVLWFLRVAFCYIYMISNISTRQIGGVK